MKKLLKEIKYIIWDFLADTTNVYAAVWITTALSLIAFFVAVISAAK